MKTMGFMQIYIGAPWKEAAARGETIIGVGRADHMKHDFVKSRVVAQGFWFENGEGGVCNAVFFMVGA